MFANANNTFNHINGSLRARVGGLFTITGRKVNWFYLKILPLSTKGK